MLSCDWFAADAGARPLSFSTLVNPGHMLIPSRVVQITGITNEAVKKAGVPGFTMAAMMLEKKLDEHYGGADIFFAIHNGRTFDVPFLQAEYARSNRVMPSNWRFIDTLELSREAKHSTRPVNHKLVTLAALYQVSPDGAHRAAADALMLSGVLAKMHNAQLLPSNLERAAFRVHSPVALPSLALPMPPALAAPDAETLSEVDLEAEEAEEEEEEGEEGEERKAAPRRKAKQAVPSRPTSVQPASDPLVKGRRRFYEQEEVRPAASAGASDLPGPRWPDDAQDLPILPNLHKNDAKDMDARFNGSLEQLLRSYPIKLKEFQRYKPGLPDGSSVLACGTIVHVGAPFGNQDKKGCTFKVETSGGVVEVTAWRFGQATAVFNGLKLGMTLELRGKMQAGKMTNPTWWEEEGDASLDPERDELVVAEWDIVSKQSAEGHKNLTRKRWLRILGDALKAAAAAEESRGDWLRVALGAETLQELQLIGGVEALRELHHPQTKEGCARARTRLAFEELFLLQLELLCRRRKLLAAAPALPCCGSERVDSLLAALQTRQSFSLTPSQRTVLDEVLGDMASSTPMQRLLMGDVGCGKTIVALLAMLAAHEAGAQAALLVPTTILADQHFAVLKRYVAMLAPADQPQLLLLTSLGEKARADALARLREGSVHLVVGTQALLQEDVRYRQLGLVVVDEEHRFGVQQRESLRRPNQDGTVPHVLEMSATPIPRSLALTAYGSCALSLIAEKPPGRGAPVRTAALAYAEDGTPPIDVWREVREEVARGGRAFVVYPTVRSSVASDLRSAVDSHAELTHPEKGVLAGLEVGLVHGEMGAEEKSAAIAAFAAGRSTVLVATKVVEVGVDIAGATLLVVENAERFGLAELHQLRGRVGRGEAPGRCLLLYKRDAAGADVAAKRMKVMEDQSDGVKIAEEDLRLRGPGELLARTGEQNGPLKFLDLASLADDGTLADRAREQAALCVEAQQVGRGEGNAYLGLHPALVYALNSRNLSSLENV